MTDVVDKYASHPAVRVTMLDAGRRFEIEKGETLVLVVTLPTDVLEWYITVKNRHTGDELCSIWYDYYAMEGESEEELAEAMREDLTDVFDKVIQSAVRVVQINSRSAWRCKLEYEAAGQ